MKAPEANLHSKSGIHASQRGVSEEQTSLNGHASPLDLFERLGCGCIVIDEAGRIIKANQYASRCIGQDIAVRNGRLVATDPTCDAELQRLVAAVLADASPRETVPSVVTLWRGTGRPLVLQISPVDGPVPPAYAGGKGLIRIVDLDDTTDIPLLDVLQSVFRLTPAEARVAQRIACGDTPEQIAERHNVSPGTIREQLKAVFQKTDTNRQSQLVGLLARLGRLSR